MKNNSPSHLYTARELFHTIGGAMRNGRINRNADNYASMRSSVEARLDLYDAAVIHPLSLESINPLWTTSCDERGTAYKMYESQPNLIQEIRNDLMRINGNGCRYKCPLCEVNNVKHLDHYVPREKMPEFSVHPQNLIYICSDCNENKSTKWLDANGFREIINVYYDRLPDMDILVCKVDSLVNNMPWAKLTENPSIKNHVVGMRELRTLRVLKIDILYEEKVNDLLQSKCLEALNQVLYLKEKEGKSIDQAWQYLHTCYLESLKMTKDIVNRMALQGMCDSKIIKTWLDVTSDDIIRRQRSI